jgi:hypothetical protein
VYRVGATQCQDQAYQSSATEKSAIFLDSGAVERASLGEQGTCTNSSASAAARKVSTRVSCLPPHSQCNLKETSEIPFVHTYCRVSPVVGTFCAFLLSKLCLKNHHPGKSFRSPKLPSVLKPWLMAVLPGIPRRQGAHRQMAGGLASGSYYPAIMSQPPCGGEAEVRSTVAGLTLISRQLGNDPNKRGFGSRDVLGCYCVQCWGY